MSKLIERANVVKYLYQFELSGETLTSKKAFESGDYTDKEIEIVENIAKNYPKFKHLIKKFLISSWTWNRIAPLERAILILGSFELVGRDKALVINEMVIIAKGYIPSESYKFINSILEKVGEFYETIKKN